MVSKTVANLESVRSAYQQLLARGNSPSAANVLKLTGGSKSTVLKHLAVVRSERLNASHDDDPSASFLADIAEPVLKKLWAAAKRHAEGALAAEVREFRAAYAGLREDFELLEASEEAATKRAELAENRLDQLLQSTSELQAAAQLFRAQASAVSSSLPAPTAAVPEETSTLLALLAVLSGADEPIATKVLYAELEAQGHKPHEAQKARTHSIDRGYIGLSLTEKGRNRVRRDEPKAAAS
ncbi:hypothetical protein ASC68_22185 [Devosia sp. Root105]|nr:hypothetical protein ASC68_22185 [Devosia sp. Root105]